MGLRRNIAAEFEKSVGLSPNSIYMDYLTFYPDGRVLGEDPLEGLARPFPEQRCQYAECGTYVVNIDSIQVKWASGTEEVYERDSDGTLHFRKDSPMLKRSYRRVELLVDHKLAGFYGWCDERGTPYVGIELRANGQFTERNLMHHTRWAEQDPSRSGMQVDGGSGRYTINRNTLELRYDTGLVARFTVLIPAGVKVGPTPESIYLNQNRFGLLFPREQRTPPATAAPRGRAKVYGTRERSQKRRTAT
jgi:hypothetical protein